MGNENIAVILKDEVEGSGFSRIGNRQESKMYLTDTRIAIKQKAKGKRKRLYEFLLTFVL